MMIFYKSYFFALLTTKLLIGSYAKHIRGTQMTSIDNVTSPEVYEVIEDKDSMSAFTMNESAAADDNESYANLMAKLMSDFVVNGNVTENSLEAREMVSLSSSRITGGRTAPVNKYLSYAKALNSNGGWDGCGGTLITPEYVITAAHCVRPFHTNSGLAKYRIGSYDSAADNGGQIFEDVNVASIKTHPNYDPRTIMNDFALVRLTNRVTRITPVKIDQTLSPSYSNGRSLMAVGIGRLTTNGISPSRLQEVDLAYDTSCGTGTNPFFCANNPGKGVCNGDSGGPTYDLNVSPMVLVGVNSVRIGECGQGSGFARIAGAYSWIKSTICASHSSPLPDFCGSTNGSITWGSIRSKMNNKSVDANQKTRGTNVHMWDSFGMNSWNQNQVFTMNSDTFQLYGTNFCLDTYPSTPGQRVYLWDCYNGNNQKWSYDDQMRLRLKANPALCLDIWYANANNGAQLVVWYCHDGSNQKWDSIRV